MHAIPFHCTLRQKELPPPCCAELRDAGGQQEGGCQSREIQLHTTLNLSTQVVQRSKDLTEQFCALESNTQLKPAFLVHGKREATATWQLSGQATGLVVLCSCVFRTLGRCAIDSKSADTENHESQPPV